MTLELDSSAIRISETEVAITELLTDSMDCRSWFRPTTLAQAEENFEELDSYCAQLVDAFSRKIPGNPVEAFFTERRRVQFGKETRDIRDFMGTMGRRIHSSALKSIAPPEATPTAAVFAAVKATQEVTDCVAHAISWERMRSDPVFEDTVNPFAIMLELHARGVAKIKFIIQEGVLKTQLHIPIQEGRARALGVRIQGEPGFCRLDSWFDTFLTEPECPSN